MILEILYAKLASPNVPPVKITHIPVWLVLEAIEKLSLTVYVQMGIFKMLKTRFVKLVPQIALLAQKVSPFVSPALVIIELQLLSANVLTDSLMRVLNAHLALINVSIANITPPSAPIVQQIEFKNPSAIAL